MRNATENLGWVDDILDTFTKLINNILHLSRKYRSQVCKISTAFYCGFAR